jgi:hypothetical protein
MAEDGPTRRPQGEQTSRGPTGLPPKRQLVVDGGRYDWSGSPSVSPPGFVDIDDAFADLERQVADQRKQAAALKTRIAGLERRLDAIRALAEKKNDEDIRTLADFRSTGGKARAAKYREQPFCLHIVNVVAPLIRAAKLVPPKGAMTTKGR